MTTVGGSHTVATTERALEHQSFNVESAGGARMSGRVNSADAASEEWDHISRVLQR